MAMWMSNLPTMVWTFTLAMPTIILIHLQNSYLTPTWSWEATNAFFPCHFRWLWGDTLYKAMLEGKKVCMCSLHEPLGEPCKILAFNSSCAKGNKYQYVLWCGLCLWWNAFSNSSFYMYIYIYYQSWATSTTTLMNKVDMKRIFVPFHFSWNHTWIWTICRQLRTWLKKFQNFKAFNKPYMLNGVDRLVSQSKAQQIRFYVQDDGVLAMHFKFFCTLPNWNWGPKDGRLVWHQGKDGKCMLSDGELNPCTSDPMMNEPTFIKGIPNQLSIGKKLCEEV